jgi:hypothetical protein
MILTVLAMAALLQTPKVDDAPAWETFKSVAGFSVSMPGNPIEQKQIKAGPSGGAENVTVTSSSGGVDYQVVRITIQSPITAALETIFFDGLRNTTAKNNKLISDKPLKFEGHSAREFVYEMKNSRGEILTVRARYVLVSPQVTFSVQVIHPADKPAPSERDVLTFFDSLKVVDFAPRLPTAVASKLEFTPFAPPNTGFTILLPGKPAETNTKKTTPQGSFTVQTYECNTVSGIFAVSVLEYGKEVGEATAAAKAEMLVKMCDALVAQDKGKIAEQQAGEHQGFPFRIVRYTFPQPGSETPNLGETRTTMVGRRLYVMLVKGPQGVVNPADAVKFFESFDLPDVSAPATAERARPSNNPAPAGAATARMRAKGAPARPGRAGAENARTRRADRISWKRFNSAVGGFSVDMPGEPEQTHEDDGLLGAKSVELVTGQHDESRFIVQYQDLTRAATKKGTSAILKAARSHDEKAIAGKVVGEKEATLKGATAGWSYQIESPDPDGPVARVRTYLVGTRLFQVIVTAPKATFPTDNSERFFRSFRLQNRN